MNIMREGILKGLKEAVWYFDEEEVKRLSEEAVKAGLDPVDILEEGLAKTLREVGTRFGNGEAFLTELIASAQAMEIGAEILNREIAKRGVTRRAIGKFLIGTVEGDIHSIGKNIVKTMLTAAGFEVIDLGIDVKSREIVEKVREFKPDILGLSSLMTTTMSKQKEVIDELKKAGLRENVKVIVGGAPVTEDWVEEIGADACGLDAGSAVKKSLKLMET
jgi:corrinoid protein of di/trimethylamine methyltransferase